jgi:hypothetical protein
MLSDPFATFPEYTRVPNPPPPPDALDAGAESERGSGPSPTSPKNTRMPRGRGAGAEFVLNVIPERVAMQLTGPKTASVFARYNIVSDGDLRDAARRLDVATAATGRVAHGA